MIEETVVVKEKRKHSLCPTRWDFRHMPKDDFIEKHGSGTLRKNTRLGMKTKSHYIEERVAFEFGYGFVCDYASRIEIGPAVSEGDCKASTEVGWHVHRMQELAKVTFPHDRYRVCHIRHSPAEDEPWEGMGVVLEQTSAPFIPRGQVVFAIIAEWDSDKEEWKIENPC